MHHLMCTAHCGVVLLCARHTAELSYCVHGTLQSCPTSLMYLVMECSSGALYKASQKHNSPSYSEQYANDRTSQEGYWLPLLFFPLSFHYRASCWDLGFFRSPLKVSEQRNKVTVNIWKGRFDHWWWQGLKNRGRGIDQEVFSKPISKC